MALNSRVYDMVKETPLQHASGLSARLGASVHIKREDLQPSFSFYIRGAYAKLAELKRQGCRGAVSASVGSRGLALATAAERLSFPVCTYHAPTLHMPCIYMHTRVVHVHVLCMCAYIGPPFLV